jgi:hypothetical protein
MEYFENILEIFYSRNILKISSHFLVYLSKGCLAKCKKLVCFMGGKKKSNAQNWLYISLAFSSVPRGCLAKCKKLVGFMEKK